MNDFASNTTLPTDSSPFREKYEIDEDGELLGEVSYSLQQFIFLLFYTILRSYRNITFKTYHHNVLLL